MQCPQNLHGCSEDLVSCIPATYTATCSCAPNCRAYRDCCWNVPYRELAEDELPSSSCVEVQIGSSWKKFIYMVTGCPRAWPDDAVRGKCEMADAFNDTFYFIPATSMKHVTYRNAFCALCNDDIDNATFWNTTSTGDVDLKMHPTTIVLKPVPEWASRRCKTYYAPVQDAEDPLGQVYRNVYCAICNGANLSALTCSPALHLSNVSVISRKTNFMPPNLAALFKPVVRNG
ncbi:hypothetical protein MTO96_030165 [Rhipicephalus appendiculatus]